MHTVPTEAQCLMNAKLARALQAAQAMGLSEPHYLWLQECAESPPEMYRHFPRQGMCVPQADVTLFH